MNSDLEKVDGLLKFYEGYKFDDSFIKEIISIRASDIRKKTKEECGELAFDLSNYSLFLQKTINKHNSIFNWADTNLKFISSLHAKNYIGMLDERKANFINESEFAKKLFNIKLYSKKVIDELSFLSEKIRFLSQTVMTVQGLKYVKDRQFNN